MKTAQTTRHPELTSTYIVNNVNVKGATLPEGWSIEWTVSSFYCEDEKCTKWSDSCELVKRPQATGFYNMIEGVGYDSPVWKAERERVAAYAQDPAYANGTYYRKADILADIKCLEVVVEDYGNGDWGIRTRIIGS